MKLGVGLGGFLVSVKVNVASGNDFGEKENNFCLRHLA